MLVTLGTQRVKRYATMTMLFNDNTVKCRLAGTPSGKN